MTVSGVSAVVVMTAPPPLNSTPPLSDVLTLGVLDHPPNLSHEQVMFSLYRRMPGTIPKDDLEDPNLLPNRDVSG